MNAVSSAVDEIQDAKLPVVTLDRSVDSQKKVPHFGANNYKGGQAIGDFVKSKFPDGQRSFCSPVSRVPLPTSNAPKGSATA
ncbi:D-ribose-binding periplasmic protein [Enterobacter cloacae]|uniref:D-ribose-binding periplasmic protein n=1 Tax=Enterobacter cloacae TaxID=550 RepID=A0A377LUL2_ENTCL|nr:D-ribose-binding periplasmic protein [Enterobacter cloacae]